MPGLTDDSRLGATFSAVVDGQVSLALVELRHGPILSGLWHRNRERLMRWEPWANTPSAFDDPSGWISFCLGRFAAGRGFFTFILTDGVVAGTCGVMVEPDSATASIGYLIDEPYEGRGFVTRAAGWLTDFGFRELGVHRIEIGADVDNHRSLAVPQRLGYRSGGVVRGGLAFLDAPRDRAVYWLARDDYDRRPPQEA